MSGLRTVALTVRFVCEMAMIAALAYWGFNTGDGAWAWVLGIGTPVLAGTIWGAFVAPEARHPVSTPVRLVIELLVFGAAVVGLAVVGQPVLAAVLGVLAVGSSLVNARTEGTPDAFSRR